MQRNRAGFTLVELLVVLVIIAILAAFLLPALTGAVTTAKEAEVVVDISNLEQGLAAFHNRFGSEAPSFFVFAEDPAQWGADWTASPPVAGLNDGHKRTARATIRQFWPDFDFSQTVDMNNDGDTTDVIVLNGAECLVFFLGGPPVKADFDGDGVVDGWDVNGFSSNSQNPFVQGGAGTRVGPFFEFEPSRLVDIDIRQGNPGESMPEYVDTLATQFMPYQYLAGYDGSSRPFGLDYDASSGTNPGTADDELIAQPEGLADGYWLRSVGSTPSVPVYPSQGQIVSPGQDGEFGTGGHYNGKGVPSNRADERDNITSFKKGRLN